MSKKKKFSIMISLIIILLMLVIGGGFADISIDKQFWINRAIAKYYGLEAIQLKVEH